MLDRPYNSPDNVFLPLPLNAGDGILCLAPHPDDEVLGCGGLLTLAQRQGLRVQTIIVTSGEQGMEQGQDDGLRLEESRKAAQILQLPSPETWGFADRELRHSPPLIERIEQALAAHQPRWLLLPALTEPHPDHQALALAGMAAAQRYGQANVLLYEVGAPTQINTVLDISDVAELKWQALELFESQEQRHEYCRHSAAMATLRSFVAGPDVTAAEAFWQIPAHLLLKGDVGASLGGWPLQRNAVGLAAKPEQLALVSIIIRSMNRPTLGDAIASVAAQTYPNIEVVVVNATGQEHAVPAYPQQRLKLNVVSESDEQGQEQRLGRSAAANLGLKSVNGEFVLFLDDDDLLSPTHLERLASELQAQVLAAAAYTGVRVEGPDGQWIRDYDLPWDVRRLRGINYLPIHSVLFKREQMKKAGARFDEALPVLEDWDFWCQLSRQGEFFHVPGVAAVYRQGYGDSHVGDAAHENHWSKWHQRILLKNAKIWGLEDQTQTLAWNAVALDKAETQRATLQEQLTQVQAQLEKMQQELSSAVVQLNASENERIRVISELEDQLKVSENERIRVSTESTEQLQALSIKFDQSQAEVALAKRSLEMLQQSRPVRISKALRAIVKK